jgi:hypothetical protein
MTSALANHLWQSTLFAALAGLLTLALRRNRAQARHWIWLVASLKFLVPFSVLIGLGGHFGWRTAAAEPLVIEQFTEPFAASAARSPLFGSMLSTVPTAAKPAPVLPFTI